MATLHIMHLTKLLIYERPPTYTTSCRKTIIAQITYKNIMVDKNSLDIFDTWNEFKKSFIDIAQSKIESDKKKFEETMGGTLTKLQETIYSGKIKTEHCESLINAYKRCYQQELEKMTTLSTDINNLIKEIDDDVDKLEKKFAGNSVPISLTDKKERNDTIREKKKLMLTNMHLHSFDGIDKIIKHETVLNNIRKEEVAAGSKDKIETDVRSQIKHKKTRRARNRANRIAKEENKKKIEDAKKINKTHEERPAIDAVTLPTNDA